MEKRNNNGIYLVAFILALVFCFYLTRHNEKKEEYIKIPEVYPDRIEDLEINQWENSSGKG